MRKQVRTRQQATFQTEVLIPRDSAEERRLQRAAQSQQITRVAKGVYVNALDPEGLAFGELGPVASAVRRNWQQIAGHLVPMAVVSHRSALIGGFTPEGELILSHPTRFNPEANVAWFGDRLNQRAGPFAGRYAARRKWSPLGLAPAYVA